MPELPEVETVKEKIKPLVGRTAGHFWSDWPRGFKSVHDDKSLSSDISGRKVLRISRHGKVVFMELGSKGRSPRDNGRLLAFHLRMSGRLHIARKEDKPDAKELKHIHAVISFTDGTELRFHDPRKFGLIWYGTPEEIKKYGYFSNIGPDALDIGFRDFKERLKSHSGMIKPLLLRQDFVAGIGNIIADETLWDAKIDPRTRIEKLTDRRIELVYRSLMTVLRRGIKAGGTTLRDWKHPDNKSGNFQKYMKVYGHKESPCPRCGNNIKRIVVGGRGTWICTKCQKP